MARLFHFAYFYLRYARFNVVTKVVYNYDVTDLEPSDISTCFSYICGFYVIATPCVHFLNTFCILHQISCRLRF